MFFKPMLLPLIAMVILTFVVWIHMYVTRFHEMIRKQLAPQKLALDSDARNLLVDSSPAAANFRNLFEMPVLFYVAVLLSLLLLIQDAVLVSLSWTYVALRAMHSLVHCTYNRVSHRFIVYSASCLVLALIWAQLAWYVIST